jgi:hypothetical protein
MNKTRIIGFVLFTIGVILQLTLENDLTDFLSGLFIGGGIGLLVTGRVKRPSL